MERVAQEAPAQAGFVAINTIHCSSAYAGRFEELFRTRAHAIDAMDGFLGMRVLKPTREGDPYLVVSFWRDGSCFQSWVGSEAFRKGHERAFRDMEEAKARGEEPPMHSAFSTYTVLAH
ncbi:MAG: antibiotic biosynthesis monooxygenase [Fimbriimonadales bacterium]|nr:antibiotic biosynthesis monooxygenase [Fimbriimonadales bacterium]